MKNVIFCLLLCYASNLMAQESTIQGYIYFSEPRMPAAYANAVLKNTADSSLVKGVISNEKGFFSINNIQTGDYLLIFSFVGYADYYYNKISIKNGKDKVVSDTIFLLPEKITLGSVEVNGTKPRIEYDIDKKIVNVANTMNLAGGTAVNALENVPSIEISGDGELKLRGSSSFTVMIDGVQSPISGSEALRMIPANTIDKIEIITNPSAKYEPDGKSGIINVILKKQKYEGFSGFIETKVGLYNKYKGTASINYKKSKYNLFFVGSVDDDHNISKSERSLKLFNDSSVLLSSIQENSENLNRSQSGAIKTGIDYTISKKSRLNVTLNYRNRYNISSNNVEHSDFVNTTIPYALQTKDDKNKKEHSELSYNYVYSIDGNKHQLKVNGNIFRADEFEGSKLLFSPSTNVFIPTGLPSDQLQNNNGKLETSGRLKMDYNRPLFKDHDLEVGVHQWYNHIQNQLSMFQFDKPVDAYTFNFLFKQYTLASYGVFKGKWKGTGYQIGLRCEHTDRIINISKRTETLHYSQWDIFPTLHLSQKLPLDMQIQASYRRKVFRPWSFMLLPDTLYESKTSVFVGNPNLSSEFNNSYEVNIIKNFKNDSYIIYELYYFNSEHSIEYVQRPVSSNIVATRPENLASVSALGNSLTLNMALFKWLQFNPSIDYTHRHYFGETDDYQFDRRTEYFGGRMNVTVKITPDTRFQGFIYAQADGKSMQGSQQGHTYYYFSLRQDFMKKKFSLTANVINIFTPFRYSYSVDTYNIKSTGVWYEEYPVMNLTFSMNLNNFKGNTNISDDSAPSRGGGGAPSF